ncbi:MAG: SsrA-binding protein SmpB [Bacillota bacterium]|jgi:SsrA-binding protein
MKKTTGEKIIVQNRRANYDYFLSDFLETGITLTGTEVKSLRAGGGSLSDSYVVSRNQELFLLNMNIAPYKQGTLFNHEPLRTRKLLAHKQEIFKISKAIQEKGLTIIPVKIYLKHGLIKVLIAVAKGKQHFDKREAIKKKDTVRKMRAASQGDFHD